MEDSGLTMSHTVYSKEGLDVRSPLLLAVHGLLGTRAFLAQGCRGLSAASAMRIVAADLRNHGGSPRRQPMSWPLLAGDLWKLASSHAEPSKPVALLGHGFGGRVALAAGLAAPQRAACLVIVDSSPLGLSPGYWNMPRALNLLSEPPQGTSLGEARRLSVKKLTDRLVNFHLAEILASNIIEISPGMYGWGFDGPTIWKYLDVLAELPLEGRRYEGPILFLRCGTSSYLPFSHKDEILRQFPRASIITAENSGHQVFEDRPLFFQEQVLEFLQKHLK